MQLLRIEPAAFHVRVFNSLDRQYESSYVVSIVLYDFFGIFGKPPVDSVLVPGEILQRHDPNATDAGSKASLKAELVNLPVGTTDSTGKLGY